MPELPEVETVVRGLADNIAGERINDVYLSGKNLRFMYDDDFADKLNGRIIKSLQRRAKYILMQLDDEDYLLAHLGMSGKILVMDEADYEQKKHDHVVLFFESGKLAVFNDPRRFGCMLYIAKTELAEHMLIKNLGPEPLTPEFNAQYLKEKFKGKSQDIKVAIMDQNTVVGVGNIYASESLFASGINPRTSAGKVSLKRLESLVDNIKDVLKSAIESGGSTLRDYVRSSGDVGYFQHKFKVYGREGEDCFVCGTKIKKITQTGRSTFYCPNCQKN